MLFKPVSLTSIVSPLCIWGADWAGCLVAVKVGLFWVERSLKPRTDQGQVHRSCWPPARMKLALSELLLVLWFRRSLLKSAFFCLSTTAGVSASPALFILVHIEWPWITFLGLFGILSVSIFHLVVCFSFVWILRLWFCCSIYFLSCIPPA